MPQRPSIVFWIAALGTFLAYLDVTIVNIAFPAMIEDFGNAGLGTLSWVVNGYALAFAALLVVLGRSADRVGRRRVYLAGVALFAPAARAGRRRGTRTGGRGRRRVARRVTAAPPARPTQPGRGDRAASTACPRGEMR